MLNHALHAPASNEWMAGIVERRTILPGERCRFVFFEEGQLQLVQHALQTDRRFVHLTERPGRSSSPEDVNEASAASDAVGTVVTILSSSEMPFGRVILDCIAGPRCRVVDRRRGRTNGRTMHVRTTPCTDAQDVKDDRTDTLRADLAARITRPFYEPMLHANGLIPPLLCAERLSFFVAALILQEDERERRQSCLYSTDTRQRLAFCEGTLMEWEADWGDEGGCQELGSTTHVGFVGAGFPR